MNRRHFLQLLATLGVAGCWGSYKAYATTSSAKARVLIIGGGAAGLSMAARLSSVLETPDITLFDPSNDQFYQPGFTMIAGGIYSPNEVKRPQAGYIPSGVKWIKEKVVSIDPVTSKLKASDGNTYVYDFLVLTPGLQMNFDQVEGVSRSTLGVGNAHCMYDYQGAQNTWKALQEFSQKGGAGVFTNTFTKLKCGGAPKKIAMLTDDYCRRNKTRDKISVTYYNASKNLFDTPYYAGRLEEIFQERDLNICPQHRLTGVDTASKKVFFEKAVTREVDETDEKTGLVTKVKKKETSPVIVDYDFLHFTPPMSAPDFVREAELGWTEGSLQSGSWVMVDKNTMVHKRYPNIVSLGDVAGLPTSKTSAAIRMQVPIAVSNLVALMENRTPDALYNGYTACPIITEYGKVLMCEFDYDKKPMPTLPLIDGTHEQWVHWLLKKYVLKPMYFHGMLNGLM